MFFDGVYKQRGGRITSSMESLGTGAVMCRGSNLYGSRSAVCGQGKVQESSHFLWAYVPVHVL